MYLNRISFSLDKAEYTAEEIFKFNRICSYFEELLFHHLPKKVNIGGYRFFHNKFTTDDKDGNIESGGHLIDFTHRIEHGDILYSTRS